MTTVSNPQAALLEFLLDDDDVVDLVANRVYPELPEAQAQFMPRPAVVVTQSGGGTIGPGARSYAQWDVTRMDVRCYGGNPGEASDVHRTVHRSIKQMERTQLDRGVLMNASISGGPVSGRDPDTKWPFVWISWEVSSLET